MAKKIELLKKNKNYSLERGKDNPRELVVQELSLVAPDRGRKDIGSIKRAIQRAESIQLPNRVDLYDTYHDALSLDGHLSGIWRKRIDAVLNKNIKFVDKQKRKVDTFDTLIYSNKFSRLVELMIESKAWGVSGVEFIMGEDFDFEEINRKHIKPEQGVIVKSQYSNQGYQINELPFVWVIGDTNDLGQLLQCVMYAIYKRGGLGDLAQYVEIFGQPVRIIYYDAYDTKTKTELRKLLDESGSSLAMMIPKQAQFEMLDGKTSNGTGELQLGFMHYCDEAMSVAVLGNSETTTSSKSSGYAQANVHSKQQLEITKSDIAFVQNILNEPQFLAILKSYGYPTDGGSFEFEMELDLETLTKRMEIDVFVSGKVPVDDDYYYNTYGIPKPDNYAELKKEMQANKAILPKQEPSPSEPQPLPKKEETEQEVEIEPEKEKPKNEDLNHIPQITLHVKDKNVLQRLSAFFFGGIREINLADYYASVYPCCTSPTPPKEGLNASPKGSLDGAFLSAGNQGGINNMDSIYQDIARRLLTNQLQNADIDQALYLDTARQLMTGIGEGLGAQAFDYDDSRNLLQAYLRRNIYHFSAAKSLTELLVFRAAMIDHKGEVRSLANFKEQIKALGTPFNEVWLETEHSTALSSAINAHRWETIETEYLEFTTVGDHRVRPQHAALDGLTYPKKHPIWNRLTPPLSYNCRCGIVPGIAANYKPANEVADQKYVAGLTKDTIFDNNPGLTRLVFDQRHPYFENLATGKLKELKYSNYGLQTLEEIHANRAFKPVKLLDTHLDYEQYWTSNINHHKGIVLENPMGDRVLFSDYELDKKNKPETYFKQHLLTRKDEPDRFKLIANLSDIIQKPDEVWSIVKKNDSQPVTNHYIKYYEGKTVLLVTVDNEAKTMFELTESGFKTRSGLLMYRKK